MQGVGGSSNPKKKRILCIKPIKTEFSVQSLWLIWLYPNFRYRLIFVTEYHQFFGTKIINGSDPNRKQPITKVWWLGKMIPIQTQTNCYNQERRNTERNYQNKQIKVTSSNVIKFGNFLVDNSQAGPDVWPPVVWWRRPVLRQVDRSPDGEILSTDPSPPDGRRWLNRKQKNNSNAVKRKPKKIPNLFIST